ncbi:MAG TPA: response regulator transcription factor [Bacteroidia bacterium]|jgi:two-component system copper resistance phosphate regulon response regulator CusR|nr:response regulator transcription factor [Bacteroidia bacterium]
MNILLIEDEPEVAAFIKTGLVEQQYNVTVVHDGLEGAKVAIDRNFDVLILDLLLPSQNGLSVCKQVRLHKKDMPILMLTALGTIGDKVQGFENGADDYLTKPFHFEELLARINALTRRRAIDSGKIYKAADLEVDSDKGTVFRAGKEITLTTKEFTLLKILISNKNKVLSRSEIAEEVWGINFDRGTNLIDVYINYLRVKIDKNFSEKLIHTVIGRGYSLKD